ncbi:probable leucine-rich repeat receptor-like serine/threonine-protein kinase At3g14840 isoform X2 [Humulus lupulus]|uniref:probable leucine-rich repeat receptor-like serine/threonine-protein kinase At3g14840 isoform X2 n=1 Tax=Humulus lupulus TaxID=3486 RepID=UPI002B40237B|nr:probable leucine-rich repeat receptor-like serine/threonine-protein kinase At3g14840 isoform X2 [Humulus lupulus]
MASQCNTVLVLFLLFLAVAPFQCKAQAGIALPLDEVKAIEEIAAQLNKKDLNFADPCNQPTFTAQDNYENEIFCNCSISANNNTCHVQSISFTAQDLDGNLPPSLWKLPHLKQVNLERNLLRGPIPREWTLTKLERLIINANNLSGEIPAYLGSITTLTRLSIESNLFSGTIPSEIGKLVNLEYLTLSANNFTGEFPDLTSLTKLKELRISSNYFTGRMPEFGNLKQLQKLEVEASGFNGQIPSSLSNLNKLIELKITDLNGESSDFPNLRNMTKIRRLVMRSCNLRGNIPEYMPNLKDLETLDLSFNKLEGEIPNFVNLRNLKKMYFTSNLLSGSIPDWIKFRGTDYQIDISYNNFYEKTEPSTCQDTFNHFRSTSGQKNNSMLNKCLAPCSKDHYSLHINCGGKPTTIGDIKYEGDEESAGAAKFFHNSASTWGFCNTGEFWGSSSLKEIDYIANNVSVLRMNNSELYTTARISPLSLTYFARCLGNGNYTVKLHFAEIVFRDNRSYYSFGRRFFDVYVQGKQELKDFNIEKKANGVDKEYIEVIKAAVSNKTLEIRFQWAGKGTKNVPSRGMYGSLISAISVESEFKPPEQKKDIKFIIIGAVSAFCLLFIGSVILWWKSYIGTKESRDEVLRGLDLQTGFFTFKQIKVATNNFDAINKIGEGGFGSVYKGVLLDGTIIAVKQLSSKSNQGNREFINEIGMISALQHPNLVKLHGCCIEGKQLLLVYEYMENNSLANSLFDWNTRQKICVGIARGLAFLHEESALKIVHRDIKATNILLDKNLNPKISDFGLAKLNEEENTHISTRVAGTIGYMAPEYALWGYLTDKADVYSFGVMTMEIVAGKKNMRSHPNENFACLLDWAISLQQKGDIMELVDPKLGSKFKKEEAKRMIKVALLCTNPSPSVRPTMSVAVSMLEGRALIPELSLYSSVHGDQSRFQALTEYMDQLRDPNPGESKRFAH